MAPGTPACAHEIVSSVDVDVLTVLFVRNGCGKLGHRNATSHGLPQHRLIAHVSVYYLETFVRNEGITTPGPQHSANPPAPIEHATDKIPANKTARPGDEDWPKWLRQPVGVRTH